MIKVYPTKAASLNLVHPIDGRLKVGGSFWTYDGFTCRCLTDNAVTEEEAKAYVPPASPPPAATAPAAAQPAAPEKAIGDSAQSRTQAA